MKKRPLPLICVFETTLECNARCSHCGSSAGTPRKKELSTAEALGLFSQLAKLGCRTITLSGGEPLMRSDWPLLVEGILRQGMKVELITNGLEVQGQADLIAEAGFFSVSFSVDGIGPVHDRLRGVPGCLEQLLLGSKELIARGVKVGAVTQINHENLDCLDEIHDLLVEEGFKGWQVQLTTPHGRAKTNSSMCLSPMELPGLEAKLLELVDRNEIYIIAADTIGHMSRGEPKLRGGASSKGRFWGSCQAGLTLVGVTSDGTVRGCLSMSPNFDEGNIRERSFEDIWFDPEGFAYNRQFSVDDLESGCATCAFGSICRGGCTNLAFASTGSTNQNLYCLRLLESDQLGSKKRCISSR